MNIPNEVNEFDSVLKSILIDHGFDIFEVGLQRPLIGVNHKRSKVSFYIQTIFTKMNTLQEFQIVITNIYYNRKLVMVDPGMLYKIPLRTWSKDDFKSLRRVVEQLDEYMGEVSYSCAFEGIIPQVKDEKILRSVIGDTLESFSSRHDELDNRLDNVRNLRNSGRSSGKTSLQALFNFVRGRDNE